MTVLCSGIGDARVQAGLQVILSGTLTFGVPLVLAIRELLASGPPSPPPPDGNAERPTAVPPLAPSGYGERPLPACLVPSLPPRNGEVTPQRARELEPA